MGTQTPNYGLNKPDLEAGDLMSDFDTWLNQNWDKLKNGVPPEGSGTTLPQSGTYNVGDRFYKTDTKSIYILITKDVNWGWFWRPIHDALSPWITVPTTCLNGVSWNLAPVAGNPFQIAHDNRGKCYWRGCIQPTSGNIARNSSVTVFKPLPNGLRPRERATFMIGHETIAVGTDGTLLTAYQGARIFIAEDATTPPSVRGFGGTADFNKIHLGGVNYAVGTQLYETV